MIRNIMLNASSELITLWKTVGNEKCGRGRQEKRICPLIKCTKTKQLKGGVWYIYCYFCEQSKGVL